MHTTVVAAAVKKSSIATDKSGQILGPMFTNSFKMFFLNHNYTTNSVTVAMYTSNIGLQNRKYYTQVNVCHETIEW